jgi:hypothetical protein
MLPSEAMFGGTGIHFLIDTWIDTWLARKDFPYWEVPDAATFLVLTAGAHDGFDLMSKFTSKAALYTWVSGLLDMLHAWIEGWLLVGDNASIVEQAVGREQRLYRPLGTVKVPGTKQPKQVWVTGMPDLWTGDVLVDWKTSSRNWGKDKAQGMLQDDIYAGLVEYVDGIALREGMYVVGDRSKQAWHEHHTTMTDASIEAALQRAYAHARDLILGTWSYSPTNSFGSRHWPCRPNFCSAWDRCPAKFLGDSYDNQPIEIQGVWA